MAAQWVGAAILITIVRRAWSLLVSEPWQLLTPTARMSPCFFKASSASQVSAWHCEKNAWCWGRFQQRPFLQVVANRLLF